MCVVIYKPFDVAVPSEERLKLCWDRNADGAGFAILMEDGEWHVKKGFMKWKKFIKAWKEAEVVKENTAIVHFRIKSAGKISPGNTHPFPIVGDYQKMKATTFQAKRIVFHNGTCGAADGDASDTMSFIKTVIDPLTPYTGDAKIRKLYDTLLTKTLDRWLITDGNAITRYGHWTEDEGCWYSNMLWKPVPVSSYVYKPHSYSNYYDDDEWVRFGVHSSERTGKIHSWTGEGTFGRDGIIKWDKDVTSTADDTAPSEAEEDPDKIVMCPNCYEDKYLDESPFVGQGDTMCMRCGCCFDEGTDTIYIFDEDLRASYEARVAARAQGEI